DSRSCQRDGTPSEVAIGGRDVDHVWGVDEQRSESGFTPSLDEPAPKRSVHTRVSPRSRV
ncbi:MAG TPA: hypothetical protein VHI97_03780, partial [Actinomycetota bacterium]|nr:hypothetical protein [Actinomycetota bacterium]